VSARDSGKTPLEAVLGEIVVTAEKLTWLLNNGEKVLQPCKRGAGVMVRAGCRVGCMGWGRTAWKGVQREGVCRERWASVRVCLGMQGGGLPPVVRGEQVGYRGGCKGGQHVVLCFNDR